MENRAHVSLADEYAAALDWWRSAGVDCEFADEAQDWLAEPDADVAPVAKPAEPVAELEAEPAIKSADIPTDLATFQAWWTDPASPLPPAPGPRLAPTGEAQAALMVLVPIPEAHDSDTLLSGPQGCLVANIAKAMGHEADAMYVASALPAHLAMPDWSALAADGLSAAIARHIELAAPQKLMLFGNDLPFLLGHPRGTAPEAFNRFRGTPVITTFAPDRLLGHARQRARLWRRILDWTS